MTRPIETRDEAKREPPTRIRLCILVLFCPEASLSLVLLCVRVQHRVLWKVRLPCAPTEKHTSARLLLGAGNLESVPFTSVPTADRLAVAIRICLCLVVSDGTAKYLR